MSLVERVLILSRSRNNLEKPENKGAGVRPHPYFRESFGHRFTFREVLILIVASLYGGFTASRSIFYVQALPAAIALLAVYLSR